MKQHQKGEVMIAVMVVMLALALWRGGHMGMMGHGGDHPGEHRAAVQQERTTAPAVPVPPEAAGNRQ